MQTPLQIANDVVDKHLGIRPAGTLVTFALSLEQIRDMIVEGVESDQEQRKRKGPTCKHCGLPVEPGQPGLGMIHSENPLSGCSYYDCGKATGGTAIGTFAEVEK